MTDKKIDRLEWIGVNDDSLFLYAGNRLNKVEPKSTLEVFMSPVVGAKIQRNRTVHGNSVLGRNIRKRLDNQKTQLKTELNNVELTAAVRDLKEALEESASKIESLESRVERVSEAKVQLELKIAQQNYLLCLGLIPHKVENSLTLPLRVYVTDKEARPHIEKILFGDDESIIWEAIGPDVENSWCKEVYYKVIGKDAEKYKAYADKAGKLRLFEKPQAEVDNLNADTIAKLSQSLQYTTEGAIQDGRVLVVKFVNTSTKETQMSAQVLSIDELVYLENNKDLMKKPRIILDHIALVHKDETPSIPENPTH